MSFLSIQSNKSEMREQLRAAISALPEDYIRKSDEGLLRAVTTRNEFIDARNIMMYCSVEREPDTLGIAEAAMSVGKTVAFPRCYGSGIMKAHIIRSLDELKPSMFNIPAPPATAPVAAPEELDLIIVPALTYDMSGHRLGYGGGYYDRYLNGIVAFTIGLARHRLIADELPRERHDIPVCCMATECILLYT